MPILLGCRAASDDGSWTDDGGASGVPTADLVDTVWILAATTLLGATPTGAALRRLADGRG